VVVFLPHHSLFGDKFGEKRDEFFTLGRVSNRELEQCKNHVALFNVNSAETSLDGSLCIARDIYAHLKPYMTM